MIGLKCGVGEEQTSHRRQTRKDYSRPQQLQPASGRDSSFPEDKLGSTPLVAVDRAPAYALTTLTYLDIPGSRVGGGPGWGTLMRG